VLLLPRVLKRLRASPVDSIVVVEGAHPLDSVDLAGATLASCGDWALGPGASLRCGLAALGVDIEAAVVVLADGPELDPRAVARVIEHRHEADVVAASYDGSRSHPVCISRPAWSRIPDEGARALEALLVPCGDLTPPGDVDV